MNELNEYYITEFAKHCVKNVCANLKIGKNCKIHDRTTLLGKNISIGNNAWIGQDCILDGTGSLKIEDGVAIGAGCYIFTHAGKFGKILSQGPVIIRKGAWLMPRVFVNPGVTIGENAVVRNCSLVTKSIPNNAVAQGSPARVIA